ncbi:hypothetical protein ACOSQ2_013251 [Xanthoceras sorbifolium]
MSFSNPKPLLPLAIALRFQQLPAPGDLLSPTSSAPFPKTMTSAYASTSFIEAMSQFFKLETSAKDNSFEFTSPLPHKSELTLSLMQHTLA